MSRPPVQPADRAQGRRFLLLHGVAHRRPPQHWLWWLAEALRQHREQVAYPQLPAPGAPSLGEWIDVLHAELAQLGAGERVVVAHSLGCALWLRAAPTLPPALRASRVLLVAPLGEQAFTAANANEAFRTGPPDRERLAAASGGAPRVVVSADDPSAPTDPRAFAAALGASVDVLAGAGHITPDDGYGPWPAVLDWCLHERTPLVSSPRR